MKNNTTNETENTSLAVAPRDNMTALQLCTNMQSVTALGQTLAQSGFFGKVSASTATAALVNCFLEGLTPLQYKAKYHTFDNGQTGVKSDYIQREFHKLGGKWKFKEWTAEKCDMVFEYKGETLPFCVTLDEFKANGVAMSGKQMKANWEKFPREMLKARCMATAIRAICPEALEGMYTQEEVADFDRPAAPMQTVAKASPSPIAETRQQADAHESVDVNVCPCGSVKGERWDALPTATLELILSTPSDKAPLLTPEHRNAIVAEIGRREAAADDGGAGECEVVEAEVVEG